MIYVSTSSIKTQKIGKSIEVLAESGFRNIELSGGTDYYEGFEEDIFLLKSKYSLNYILHNYFPPPKEHFVSNLASLNDELYKRSMDNLINAILLSKELRSPCFGLHAGFLLDLEVAELGHPFTGKKLFDREKGIQRFCSGFRKLEEIANGQLDLYIENNVLTAAKNADKKPLMLVTHEDYIVLKKEIKFNLLFDIGHLKISSKTLSLDFKSQAKAMAKSAKYYHLSDNNGLIDKHLEISEKSDIWGLIKSFINKDSIITLEIKGLDELRRTHDIVMRNLK